MLSATSPVGAVRPVPETPRAAPTAEPPKPPLAPAKQLRIEPALQLVVTEFRTPDGEVRQSIPTPREIDAYRNPPLPSPDKAADAGVDVKS
ncbi:MULTISPECIES: hypothetical protein [Roseomonadaceae]|uniref:Uncharacterized protein n=1 Tax=Falsiroseomonas oleicola TaxID=2801474 RepID=A0ABS6H6S0_9PROT|nr:hypothetical protein [Roseomonas oleicola]MBU8543522.1 hypothetical protein [Roseomonas oleicola]